jgi:hypothetical protein
MIYQEFDNHLKNETEKLINKKNQIFKIIQENEEEFNKFDIN